MTLIDQDGYAATLYRELDHREPFATIEGPIGGVINPHITLVTRQVTRLTPQDARNLAAHLIEAANAATQPMTREQEAFEAGVRG